MTQTSSKRTPRAEEGDSQNELTIETKLKLKLAVMFLLVWLPLGWLDWSRASKYQLPQADTQSKVEGYEVKRGDTIFKIARQYGVSVEQLREANGLKTNQIRVGQRLLLAPKPAAAPAAVPVENFHIAFGVVNVYRKPSTDSSTETQALHGEPVKVLTRRGSWVKVSLPDQFDYRGWMQVSALRNIPTRTNKANRRIVSVFSAKVRTLPRKDAPVLVVLPLGTVVASEQSKADGNFTLVQLVDGRKGYVFSTDLLDYSERDIRGVSSDRILKTASLLLGQPYLWGGMTSPGVDCSGFIHTVFKVHGIRLHRDADLQYLHDGVRVAPDKLQPGDLVFFETYAPGASHVGIYAGNREFIQAASSKGVSYGSLDDPYYSERFLGAKRVLRK